ncbi:MAG: acylphosphatase [Reichenbachiella sp.]
MNDIVGKSIIVKGKVQGVFYRASTVTTAQNLKLTGWVKNLQNGDVEIRVFGPSEPVAELIVWCSKGPEFSQVELVNSIDIPLEKFKQFKVAY